MLTAEQNERLTRVGPGTPMGELMRRYWHPVATSNEIADNPVKAVRILGESLTLFRDRQGRLGLIGERCPHRRVNLRAGIPEEEGLRCPYHGWMFDHFGQCIEQPAETGKTNFMDRVKLPSYPVQELGGLIWTYMGPSPAPLLPRWDLLVSENTFRQIGATVLPCNWLQCQENAVDTVHTEFTHGRFGLYAMERKGSDDEISLNRFKRMSRRHAKFDFKQVPVGIQKFRLIEGEPETAEGWTTGHPLVFPNIVRITQLGYAEFQIRVPLDDTHTWHLSYQAFFPGDAVKVPEQNPVPSFEVPIEAYPEFILGQDYVCWVEQGEIMDRTQEQLGRSDVGLVMFRKLLEDQIKVVQDGGDPINTYRDPEENRILSLSHEDHGDLRNYRPGSVRYMPLGENSPVLDELDALMMQGAEAARSTS